MPITKNILLFLFFIFGFKNFGQTIFEDGYFIDNKGNKTECQIKNEDWRNNPTEFQFRAENDGIVQTANIESVLEFGITNKFKYQRTTVQIDMSSESISSMSSVRQPEFETKTIFLNVLLEGKASLFEYFDGNLKRFFFRLDKGQIQQLVYKQYIGEDNQIRTNFEFKQQLINNLKCSSTNKSAIENLSYATKPLLKFFKEYNTCSNQDFNIIKKEEKRDKFNLSIRPGLTFSSLSINNSVTNSRDTDFGNDLGFRIGIEAEYVMPFNNDKWTIVTEPTFQSYKSENRSASQKVKANYSSIEIPIGLRHYMFLNDNSKFFLNAFFIIDITNTNAEIEFESSSNLDINGSTNLAIGLGYKHNDTYSIEFRYKSQRELLSDYASWNGDFNSLSLIFGYTLF